MTGQWLYKVLDVTPPSSFKGIDAKTLQDVMNEQGLQGWELVQVVQHEFIQFTLFFKKPK